MKLRVVGIENYEDLAFLTEEELAAFGLLTEAQLLLKTKLGEYIKDQQTLDKVF